MCSPISPAKASANKARNSGAQLGPGSAAGEIWLLLHVFLQVLWANFRAIDYALRICRDSLCGARAGVVRITVRVGNECFEGAIFGASDSYASLPGAMIFGNRA